MSVCFAQVSVQHQISDSSRFQPITVTVSVKSDSTLKVFDIGEMIPVSWKVESWKVNGYGGNVSFEEVPQVYIGKQYNMNHWQLKDGFSGQISIEYKITGKSSGNYDFASVWLYPTKFGTENYQVKIR